MLSPTHTHTPALPCVCFNVLVKLVSEQLIVARGRRANVTSGFASKDHGNLYLGSSCAAYPQGISLTLMLIFSLRHPRECELFSSLTSLKGPLGTNTYQPVILRKLGLSPNKGPTNPKHRPMGLQVNVSTHAQQADNGSTRFTCPVLTLMLTFLGYSST